MAPRRPPSDHIPRQICQPHELLRAQLTHPEPPDVDGDVPSRPARVACAFEPRNTFACVLPTSVVTPSSMNGWSRPRCAQPRQERGCGIQLGWDLRGRLRRRWPHGQWIVDVDGFANWGNPGSVVDYDASGFVVGALVGKKFEIGGMPLRIELDGTFGGLSAASNRLDPNPGGFDETVKSESRWIATARAGDRAVHRPRDGIRLRL